MTSTYSCPNCTQLCQFDQDDCGQNVPCPHCGQWMTVPAGALMTAEPVYTEPGKPLPGFYKEAFLKSWKIFLNPSSALPLVFIIALTCLKFFLGSTDYSFTVPGLRIQLPIGQIVTIIALGGIFWYFMELVPASSQETEQLPSPDIGSGFEFIFNIAKSLYYFVAVLIIVEIPFMILASIIQTVTGPLPGTARLILMFLGLFMFPIGILTISAGRDIWMIFFPKYMITPLKKAFIPYLPVAIMVIASVLFYFLTLAYSTKGKSTSRIAFELTATLAATAFSIIAFRSIGIFCKHYSCYLDQLETD